MPEGKGFKPDIEQIKVDLKAPKTAEQWCRLYHELLGKNVYRYMSWGNEAESQKLLTYDDFQKKVKACQINLGDFELIADANKKIQE